MRPTVTFVARSICIIMSVVYLLVTTVSPAKTDEPIDMSFAVWTQGPKEPSIDLGGFMPLRKRVAAA